MLDELDPIKVIEKCNSENTKIPKMLEILKKFFPKIFIHQGKNFWI